MPTLDSEKLYRGAYTYTEQGRMYSEETFEIYKNEDNSIEYVSTLQSRVANGEFLKIHINYIVNKEFTPIHVTIEKILGSQQVKEYFISDLKAQVITYAFESDDETKEFTLGLPPKFYVATPSLCASFLFFPTKKFDYNTKNFYSVVSADNMWTYDNDPVQKRICVEAPTNQSMNIKVGDSTLQCHQYNISLEDEITNNPLIIYVSKHMHIPYRVLGPMRTKLEIQYLNHVEKEKPSLIG